jgi:hypothetical protein
MSLAKEYIINPVLMGGLVKEVTNDKAKIHLFGRLGTIFVDKNLIIASSDIQVGDELEFYFSYIQVVQRVLDYDSHLNDYFEPHLVGAKITEVNDTAIKVLTNDIQIAVPRRWVFTDTLLEVGQNVEFYFSCLKKVENKK